jgi:sporulenol synthase
MNTKDLLDEATRSLVQRLLQLQDADGAWRLCFESGTLPDAYMIIITRALQMEEQQQQLKQWCDRILSRQTESGAWRLYADETEGNLSATVECYLALLYSGMYQASDEPLLRAEQYIVSRGGLKAVSSLLTKVLLAVTGQQPWPRSLLLPIELLLIPKEAPISFFDFVGYARVHIAPALVLADQRFVLRSPSPPSLSHLLIRQQPERAYVKQHDTRDKSSFLQLVQEQLLKLGGLTERLRHRAVQEAERFMLQRLETDGTLYSYASATFLMIFALLSLGYPPKHPVLQQAYRGLLGLPGVCGKHPHVQNCTSTVWDTSLISHALQAAGVSASHPAIARASAYILSRQQRKLGDWHHRNPNPYGGGWGFSDINTINPDVDDTSAALRALKQLRAAKPYQEAWNLGLYWLLTMQNDDGGWPAFEKNTDLTMLTWIPMEHAADVAIDASSADLTGRTLEFLGTHAGLSAKHSFVQRGSEWLVSHQEEDGSWYGRWGICYIYGTWAALTGLAAVGIEKDSKAVRRGTKWLLSIQHEDGSWGESCRSDEVKHYVPLSFGTPSQTAWALDALIAVHDHPTPEMVKGLAALAAFQKLDPHAEACAYPTGAGLPGFFYTRYHSYSYIWPLVTLANYKRKYGG